MLKKIISGGQIGVDRAGLDAATRHGFSRGGWCPKGRLDEAGIIPPEYVELMEHSAPTSNEVENYNARTVLNIKDSDGTMIFVPRQPLPKNIIDGTVLTLQEVRTQKKPYVIIDLSESRFYLDKARRWINDNNIVVLNIAGPRESSSLGIYKLTSHFLDKLFFELNKKYCS